LLDNQTILEDLDMRSLDVTAAILLVIGGLNWGLVGAANFDLVATVFGPLSPLSRVVYVLVGLAALYQAVQWKAIQHRWSFAPVATAR
jgi:uncharacterized protein